jgi:hypothetical protein
MKKLKVFVCIGLMTLFVSGALFAGGLIQRGAAAQGRVAEEAGLVEVAKVAKVAEVAEVAEVVDTEFFPRQNPAVIRAEGSVYALPATPLLLEAERLPPPVYAISGIRGVEISEGDRGEAVDIVVNLPQGESFSRGILEGEDVSGWVENLPAGLEARSHGVKRGATVIRMYVSGIPTVTGRDAIRVRIPGTYLTGGNDRQFVSPTEEASQRAWEAGQTE